MVIPLPHLLECWNCRCGFSHPALHWWCPSLCQRFRLLWCENWNGMPWNPVVETVGGSLEMLEKSLLCVKTCKLRFVWRSPCSLPVQAICRSVGVGAPRPCLLLLLTSPGKVSTITQCRQPSPMQISTNPCPLRLYIPVLGHGRGILLPKEHIWCPYNKEHGLEVGRQRSGSFDLVESSLCELDASRIRTEPLLSSCAWHGFLFTGSEGQSPWQQGVHLPKPLCAGSKAVEMNTRGNRTLITLLYLYGD